MKQLIAIVFFILSTSAYAEVTAKAETGFNLKIVADAPVTPQVAYDQFLKVGEWWVSSHTWTGDAANMSITAKPGGCFCEMSDDLQVLHMTVTYVKPGEEIKMVGGLGPLQMMGLHGGMSWRFEPTDTGTRITQTYNVTGYAPGGLLDLADIVDAVQTQQHNALIKKLSSE